MGGHGVYVEDGRGGAQGGAGGSGRTQAGAQSGARRGRGGQRRGGMSARAELHSGRAERRGGTHARLRTHTHTGPTHHRASRARTRDAATGAVCAAAQQREHVQDPCRETALRAWWHTQRPRAHSAHKQNRATQTYSRYCVSAGCVVQSPAELPPLPTPHPPQLPDPRRSLRSLRSTKTRTTPAFATTRRFASNTCLGARTRPRGAKQQGRTDERG